MKLNLKQTKAYDYLYDNVTTELLYGGGAGGGKSVLGCAWLCDMAIAYPGSRWLMGRAELKTLKETTLKTFFEVCAMQGLTALIDYSYNQQSNVIQFFNGSEILMKDLFLFPSDPNFDSLGSLELTGAFIDECNQLVEKAKNIVKSRIRFKLDEFGIIPKLLMTCNPAKNWTYHSYYKPFRDGMLPNEKKFIQALVGDNRDISKHYRENLLSLDENSKQRLLYGNWEYDDDPATLINYDKIIDCFTNSFLDGGNDYITADIARFGSDKTVIGVWNGYRVSMYSYNGLSVSSVASKIQEFQQKHKISNSHTIADEDGVGGGVVDILRCKGFVNNSMPLPEPDSPKDKEGKPVKPNYRNLKSQCYFRLAERINKGGLYIDCKDVTIREMIIQELEQVKQFEMDKDVKKQVMPKDKVKELIGRSPDFSDTLMMREWFELVPKRVYADAQY